LLLISPCFSFFFPSQFSCCAVTRNFSHRNFRKEFRLISSEFYRSIRIDHTVRSNQSLDTAKGVVEDPPTQQQQQQHSAPVPVPFPVHAISSRNCSSLTRAYSWHARELSCPAAHKARREESHGREMRSLPWSGRSPNAGAPPHVILFPSSLNRFVWRRQFFPRKY
jgi:hypothetical protein